MGQEALSTLLSILLATVGIMVRFPADPVKRLAEVVPTPTVMIEVTPTESVTPTTVPTIIPTKKLTPTITPTPSIVPTPTIDQKAVDICNTAFMPVIEFAGHECLAGDANMRWVDSMNGYPVSEAHMDEIQKGQREGQVRPKLLKECLKTTKEKFEKCSSSIRDNANRIRDELSKKIQNDIAHCINSSTIANGTMKNLTPRLLVKDRLMGKIPDLYNFCSSHNDSVAEYHP